jgi:hypothetical protein
MHNFKYQNTEIKYLKGGKIVRKVTIKNGKGYKSVTRYNKGKKLHSSKKRIHKDHIDMIQNGKFIPSFFSDCKKTRKNKK